MKAKSSAPMVGSTLVSTLSAPTTARIASMANAVCSGWLISGG
jgi:hypothetical protein